MLFIDGFRWSLETGVDRYLFRTVRLFTGGAGALCASDRAGMGDQMIGGSSVNACPSVVGRSS